MNNSDITAQFDLYVENSKEYEVEEICNNKIYIKETDCDYLITLYYLVSWNGYLENKNI